MKPILALLLILTHCSLHGKTTEWKLAGEGDWHEPSNWTNGIPSNGDSALITLANSIVNIQNTAQAEYIFIASGTQLTINGDLSLQDSAGDAIIAEGMLKVGGSISIVNPQGEGLLVTDSIFNSGTIFIQNVLNFPHHGMQVNNGKLENLGSIFVSNCRIGFRCSECSVLNDTSGSINAIACGITFRQSSQFSTNKGALNTTAGSLNIIEGGKLGHVDSGVIGIEGGALRVNKGSIFNSLSDIIIKGDRGIEVSFGGNLNLKDGSECNVEAGMGDRLNTFEGGKITINTGAVLLLE